MNDADLEQRLTDARPAIPEPPPSARDRAREAALAALPRRRLRRGWVLAVAAAIVVGALIVPTALGVGGGLLDLLPLGGEGQEEEEKQEERFRGACAATTIEVTFDPAKGAAVTSGGETLAFAGFGRHEVADSCTPLPTTRFGSEYPASAFEDLPDKGVYEATTLVCTVPGTVELDAHPIWDDDLGRVGGSNLFVLQGDPPRALVSAVLKEPEPGAYPGTSRIYYLAEACQRG
jgi:hypothetical protein